MSARKLKKKAKRNPKRGSHSGAVGPQYDGRLIVLAQGIEKHNKNIPERWRIPDYLEEQLGSEVLPDSGKLALQVSDDRRTTQYKSVAQHINYTIKLITRKDEFKKYLTGKEEEIGFQPDKVMVIYNGHSRYGRGACFGDLPADTEDWSNGSNIEVNGLFRMAYPHVPIPVADIIKHGYTCRPVRVPVNKKKPKRIDCHYDIRARYSKLKPFTLKEIHKDLHKYVKRANLEDKFWGLDMKFHGKLKRYVVLHAGWDKTDTTPYDLGGTELNCKVFGHFGCSSFKHFNRVVRKFKKWRRGFFYCTSASTKADDAAYWIFHVLDYKTSESEKLPPKWSSILPYAVVKTNDSLSKGGRNYEIWPKPKKRVRR